MGAGAGCGAVLPVGALGAGVGSLMAMGSGAATTAGALVMAFLICGGGVGGGGGGGGGRTLGTGSSMNCDKMTAGTTSSTARVNRPL